MTDDQASVPDTPEEITSFKALGFFAADYAVVEAGKVYASGAYFSVLRFPAFPASLASMALVTVILAPFHSNSQDHTIEMAMLDPDGKPTSLRVQGSFKTAPNLEHKYGEPGTVPLVVPISGLQFPKPGKYTFTLSIDRKPLGTYTVDAIQVATVRLPQSAQPPQE